MKKIQKVVQKLSHEQKSAAAAAARTAAAYEPVQKHKVTPGIPGRLNKIVDYSDVVWASPVSAAQTASSFSI